MGVFFSLHVICYAFSLLRLSCRKIAMAGNISNNLDNINVYACVTNKSPDRAANTGKLFPIHDTAELRIIIGLTIKTIKTQYCTL